MTNEEFLEFSQSLFVAFPSLREWLADKSPDPQATLRVWRKTLAPYTLAECMSIVDAWSCGELPPFEAYERDKVHLRIRSHVALRRDRAARKREAFNAGEPYRRKQRGEVDMAEVLGDSSMAAAELELRPIHKRMLDGEITQAEYRATLEDTLEKHGIGKETAVPEAWAP